jgi:hypothetical protein
MRRLRKSDWFSIVATDLFCGALCAVIILDAVSKKAPTLNDGPGRVSLSFPMPSDGCESVLVIVMVDTAASEYMLSSMHAISDGITCVTQEDLPDLTAIRLRTALLAKGDTDFDVKLVVGSVPDVTCSTENTSC